MIELKENFIGMTELNENETLIDLGFYDVEYCNFDTSWEYAVSKAKKAAEILEWAYWDVRRFDSLFDDHYSVINKGFYRYNRTCIILRKLEK